MQTYMYIKSHLDRTSPVRWGRSVCVTSIVKLDLLMMISSLCSLHFVAPNYFSNN